MRLFAEVNRELIHDDEEKKWKGKKTRRYKISRQFIAVTESVEKILSLMRKLKVVSLSEMKLTAPDARGSVKLRSVYDHFYELEKEK